MKKKGVFSFSLDATIIIFAFSIFGVMAIVAIVPLEIVIIWGMVNIVSNVISKILNNTHATYFIHKFIVLWSIALCFVSSIYFSKILMTLEQHTIDNFFR